MFGKLMILNPRRFMCASVCALVLPCHLHAQTVITNTRAEVSFMASLWETDPIQISALANAQYPSVGGGTSTWKFVFPGMSILSDGDIHINMGIAATGNTGTTSGNSGESPIVPEVINATSTNLTIIDGLSGKALPSSVIVVRRAMRLSIVPITTSANSSSNSPVISSGSSR